MCQHTNMRHTCIHECTHTHTHTHTHIHTQTHTYIHTCMYACIHTRTHTHSCIWWLSRIWVCNLVSRTFFLAILELKYIYSFWQQIYTECRRIEEGAVELILRNMKFSNASDDAHIYTHGLYNPFKLRTHNILTTTWKLRTI